MASESSHATSLRDTANSVKNWFSVLTYLMVQTLNRQTRAGRFSTILTVAEPFMFILFIYYFRGMIRGLSSQFGTSLFLFLASGFLPFFLFFRTASQGMISARNAGRPVPRISSMDQFLAATLTAGLIWTVMIGLIFVGMIGYGIEQARMQHPNLCLTAIALLFLFGCGMGLINASIIRFFPFWKTFATFSTRGLLFFSGVIHIPITYPSWLMAWLAWNPAMHAIELFRIGVYGHYPSVLDWDYLLKSVLIVLFIGVVADRATLRKASR